MFFFFFSSRRRHTRWSVTGVQRVLFRSALGEHEAITRAEVELLPLGAEGDLALDHPEALVVVVRMRRVVGVGRIGPREGLEAVGGEARGERALGRLVRALPGNLFETHGADSPCCTPTPARGRRS